MGIAAASAGSAPLILIQDPAGTGLYSSLVTDSFTGTGVANGDEWSFEAETGDRVSVRLEAAVGNSRPRVRLLNAANTALYSFDGATDGVGAMSSFVIPAPGTYRVRVYSDHAASAYQMRVDLGRAIDLESESNDTFPTANVLTPQVGLGSFGFSVAGLITEGDTAGDVYSIGVAPAGSTLAANVQLPSGSLTASDLSLQLWGRRSADRALDFNGSTYAAIPHNPIFDAIETANAVTIEAWIYIRSWPQGYFCIFDKYRQVGDTGWFFSIQSSAGGISFWNSASGRVSSDVTPSINTWHHVAVAYDHAANSVRFYLNGALIATRTSPGALTDTNIDPAYIGYGPSGTTNEFNNGAISELRLWNRALTTAEIQSNYVAATIPASASGLAGLWRFDEGSGLTAADATAAGNHATLGGGDTARVPTWSSGAIRPIAVVNGTSLSHTFADEAVVWLALSASANRGLSARYLLTGSLSDSGYLQVVSTSLPSGGATTTDFIQGFNVTFDDELNPTAANNLANYTLRGAGPDLTFGTADDISYTLGNPQYTNGVVVTVPLLNGPIQPGLHRLTLGLGLRDRSDNPLAAAVTTDFTMLPLDPFRIENQNNDTFATATSLAPLTADGSGFIGGGRGNIRIKSDLDYYSFPASAGDRVIVGSENPAHASATGILFRVYGPNQVEIVSITSGNGSGQNQFIATTTGTHYVRAEYYYDYSDEYRLAVAVIPGNAELESEGNNTIGVADPVTWAVNAGGQSAAMVGVLSYGDSADCFAMGFLDVGADLSVSATKPPSSSLIWVLEIMDASGAPVISAPVGGGTLSYKVPAGKAGNFYVRIRPSAGADLLGQYRLAFTVGDSTLPAITADTLPAEGATVADFFGNFQLTFSKVLQAAGVNTIANYDIRSAGADGVFDTADDVVYSPVLMAAYTGGFAARYRLGDGPAQPGLYRVKVMPALVDLFGNAMAAPFVRTFTVAGVADYPLETRSNDTFATATSLAFVSDGAGRLARARGQISHNGDLDHFSFEAVAGHSVVVSTENPGHVSATGLQYRVYGPDQSQILEFATSDGTGQGQFIAPTSGTYYVRVQFYYDFAGEYRLAVATSPDGRAFEREGNNSAGVANALTWSQAAGVQTSSIGGLLSYGDASDWYALGFVDVGTDITVSASKPGLSTIVWLLDIIDASSTVVATSPAGAASLVYTVPASKGGNYYARIRPVSGAGLLAHYGLSVALGDTKPPVITGDTLPAQGSAVTDFFGEFQLTFSETMAAATVNAPANYELRAAGPDGVFDTADDIRYSVVLTAAYTNALSANYRVSDGPVQPGSYRLQVKTGLTDLYGNALAAVYTRTFYVVGVPDFVLESRSNDSFATATSLSPNGGNGPGFSGSWSDGVDYATGGNSPMGIATADFDNDGILDLVSANYDGGTISVLKGRGDGTFITPATIYPAPNNPFKVVVGDLNGDGRPDVVVTRRNGSAVRVFLNTNDGAGTLAAGVDLVTPQGPIWLALCDLNGDGHLDIATANYEGNSVSIFYNNGNGTFAPAVSFPVTGNPYGLAAGDLNGDGRVDLAVGTWADRSVKIFYRQAAGTYAPGSVFNWGAASGINSVAIGDVNGDGRADLLAVSDTGPDVRRWHQQADGTLLAADSLSHGGNVNGYSVMVQDYNGDGQPDVIVGRNDYVAVFENRGGGVFGGPSYPYVGRTVRAVVVADFNGDGRPDLAVAAQQANALKVFLGRGTEPLQADGNGFIARARGQLATSGDFDYYRFSAKAGDRVIVGSENPAHANFTGIQFRVYRAEGDEVASLTSSNGSGQAQFIAPVTGLYYVRAQTYYTYSGEYRFMVAVLPGTMGLENEDNDNAARANPVAWIQAAGTQTAAIAGVVNYGDLGDWFQLGALAEGTQVTIGATKPPSSGLNWILDILNSSSTVVASGATNATPVTFSVPPGAGGTYYARIRAASGADLLGQYLLRLTLTDTKGPSVVANSLPSDASTTRDVFDRFMLTFSKDMEPSSVNALANYDLRSAGPDNTFDTADDVVVPLLFTATYTSGLNVSFRTANGATLPVGSYRFRALSGLVDKFGNALSPIHERFFAVAELPGYNYETEPNNTRGTATPLVVRSSQPGLYGAGGRGYLLNGSDIDFWSFELLAGDRVYIQGEIPGNPNQSGLTYQLFDPSGASLGTLNAESNGMFAFPLFTATQSGAYALRVAAYWGYYSEYRFRVYILRGGLQVEVEPNNSFATASPMALAPEGNNLRGSLHGLSRIAGDLDYINLGTLQAGTTVFLSTRQPTTSTFAAVVSLYNSAGVLLPEAAGGRTGDPVAQVTITTTGVYYAVVRTAGVTDGLDSEYILDVLVVPTAGISFPNLQVTSLTPPPATGLKSGDATTISFRVDNLGNLATEAVTWFDRVVLSTDTIYGNADDIELGVFTHTGPLNALSNYVVSSAAVTIPDGIAGNYYVIVRTDHTNTVNEFVLEGDNETVTENPIAITRADYPDLVIENLAVGDPDGSGHRLATWTLANRGLGTAAAGFAERFSVRNTSTGASIVNTLSTVTSALAPGGTISRQGSFTTMTAGNYVVEVIADAQSQRYEYNASGHGAAEANNVSTATFAVTQLYTLTVAADPVSGGSVAGGGTYVEGSARTVIATATAPYVFVGWFEGAFLRSVDASYTSPLLSNRTLTARFSLPTFVIATQVNPPGTGVVTGGGVHALANTVTLTASAAPGYRFDYWSEGAATLGSVSPLTFSAAANRTIVANFAEANPTHVVTTATQPAGVATVSGAGTYNNGQTAVITAPATVSSGEEEYVFERFLLNGSSVGTAASITKTFTTLDPAALAYVAEYKSQGLKPVVAQVSSNLGTRIGLTSNFQLTIRFDRAMKASIRPLVELLSANATSLPTVSAVGSWTAADTYVVPAITVGANHGGDYRVRVSLARDMQDRLMTAAEVFSFIIDVTAPELPTLTAGPVTATSAGVDWTGYAAPADLASFRVYRSDTTFTSVDGLSPIASLPAGMRSYGFAGLALDTDYFVAVVPVDTVGNAATTVAPFTVRIASTIPPAVGFDVAALSTNAARVTWTFDAAGQIGFKGFKIYRQPSAFTSITGLTPIATLAETARSFDDLNLDRAQTHHYAVVAFNRLDQSVQSVVSKPWSDPLADSLETDFTATDPLLIIANPLTIRNGATFTVPPGTVVAFAPGAGIIVESGRLVAEGTPFSPVIFTSLADVENSGPTRGSWNGLALADATRTSLLKHVWIKYGRGLAIAAGNHVVDTLGAVWNDVGALRLSGAVSLTTQSAYLANNTVGAGLTGGASLVLTGSVIKNNGVNAAAAAGGVFTATGNWWGTADAAAIAATLSGVVDASAPLAGEPILTRGLRSADGATVTGLANLPMHFASLNATGYRVSEDSNFAGVVFVDVPRDSLSSDLFNTRFWSLTVPLSPGGGTKTLHAQFRSPTGVVSPTISFTTNFVTSGPVISAFSLAEGQTLHRPLTVTASATGALPVVSLVLQVDTAVVATAASPSLTTRWDIRSLTPGVHRVRLIATDSAGQIATREFNVVVNPNPPPRPVITAPANNLKTTASEIAVTGTAEGLADVRILRNGAVVATVAANAAGAFTAASVPLVEGTNELVASAFDAVGSTSSAAVYVNSDTGAPAPVTLLPIAYNPGQGVFVDWDLPTSGEIPLLYRVLWHTAPFTSAAEASGQSEPMLQTYAMLKNLPDGLRYFAVVGYDEAGNASPLSNLQSFTVDLTPPSFTIAYSQAMPVGPGSLGITVTASEPLAEAPLVLMRPQGGGLFTITLAPAGGNSYTATFPVTTLSARSGTAAIGVTGKDLAGNAFTGAPAGPALVFDLTKPTGALNTSRAGPIQTSTDVTLGVSLVMSEPLKSGTQPTLSFSPPAGGTLPITLSGAGLNWSGQLTVTAAMGNGHGTFLLNAQDAVGNVGTVLTTGERLELYNTETPVPPAIPANVTVQPLKGGYIRLAWAAVEGAHSYRLYREPGASAAVPTVLVTSDITALSIDDLPPADGAYRYVVTSFRLGAESGPSGVRATTSDRTPPPAPTATTALLGTSGINIAWTVGVGEPAHSWVIYRNGTAIRTISNPAADSFVDSPPRGVMNYAVAAADVLGNEAQGPVASIELLVGAPANLVATVDPEAGTTLTWSSSDATATGYNLYRNGSKQNASPLASRYFNDTFPAGGQPVLYAVKAVNASGQESAARTVLVQPLTTSVHLNPTDEGDLRSVARYFDTYAIAITAGANASAPVSFSGGEIVRTVTGETPAQALFPLPSTLAAGETKTAPVVIPAPNLAGIVQGTSISLSATADVGGGTVVYRLIEDFEGGLASGLMMSISSDRPPLAGGLADFTIQVFNRGHASADLVLSRGGNALPGDLEMLITTAEGVLVSSTPLQASMPGVIVNEQGDAFLRVAPGASVNIPFAGVLVPEGLSTQTVNFRARFKTIYHALGTAQQRRAGPLEGAMNSSLRVTPYYATATTDQPAYADDQPVIISGQALSRETGQPVPNVPVRVGIRVRGAVIYQLVMTDATGAYSHSYTPSLGLAGELVIWAAHPEVVDQLNQVRVKFYRLFTKPGRVEAVMSKNDTLDFDVALLNTSDLPLSGTTVDFRAYRIEAGGQVAVAGLTGSARSALPAALVPKAEPKAALRLQATLEVPDDALFEFTFRTAEGASTKLTGTISFRPALAVLSTKSPTTGYAEAGLGRGQLKSVEITVENRGLRTLSAARIVAPANVPWMHVNLAPDASGQFPLADIPVGGTRSFSIVFAPPADTPVGFYNDFLVIKGDNAVGDYRLNLFATVTSEEKGAAQFAVTNTFGNPVPNTSVWLRNTTLGIEVGPVLTDVNGMVLVPGLMEGDWQWKTQAAGHGATQGVVTIVPDQTVGVETELTLTMVTVKFSVVPVPFTDYYEIKIEQTFQTRTPIPNLVLTPPHQTLNVEAGWSGTLLYTLRNEGLRSMFDVVVSGGDMPTMRATPLVGFIPELKAQESIQIPVFFEYFGPADASDNGEEETIQVGGLRAASAPSSFGAEARGFGPMSLGPVDDIIDCYKEFKYGTITLKAAGGISSVSGKPYTVGVNATIDVDELLALVCDGDCPDNWTGGGIIGGIADKACGKLVGKIVDAVKKKTKVVDLVCKASNIIKAIACAAAQLPSGHIQSPPSSSGGSGGGGSSGGQGFGGNWTLVGSGCFVAGTPITLADGSTLPVEQLTQGTRLLANPAGRADSIAQLLFLNSDHVRELTYRSRGSVNAPATALRLTHDHRVWVDGRGWTFASEVKVGDWLHGADGKLHQVISNDRLSGRHDVYGLHMGSDNVIYAGGVLTEDQCFKAAPGFSVSPQNGGAR